MWRVKGKMLFGKSGVKTREREREGNVVGKISFVCNCVSVDRGAYNRNCFGALWERRKV